MKSEILKLVIKDKKNDSLINSNLKSYRILCLIAVILIPAFWLVHKSINADVIDFLSVRLIFSLLFFTVYLVSFISNYAKENIIYFVKFLYYLLTFWLVYLNFLNKFSSHYIALVVVAFCITLFEFTKPIQLIVYPSILISVTSLACFLITVPDFSKALYISNLATVSLMAYIVSTSRLKIQEEIAIKQKLMTTIFDESADALILFDPDSQTTISYNAHTQALFEEITREEVIGVDIKQLCDKKIINDDVDIREEIAKHGFFYKQKEYLTKTGKKVWGDLVIKEIEIVGETILLARISDITQLKQTEEALQKANDELERRVEERTAELSKSNTLLKQEISDRQRAEKQLIHGAFHDTLTALPNRALFMDRLEHAVERTKRSKDYLIAVLFLDLDRFKIVNDSLGHMVGDQLLLAITSRIKTCLRSGDTFARLGGDEFTILLEDIKDISDAERVANRIQEELKLPFNLNGHEVFTTASIGIALSKTAYDRPEQLLRDADTAMYRAKALGKARHEVFDTAMHKSAIALLQLETDLRRAIERQEFRLHYQPIVSIENCKLVGFEALIRWQHPDRGFISPAEFITVAEETGLIVPIGWWIFREACYQMHLWQKKFPTNPPLTISVNISAKQFSRPELSEKIKQILQETSLDPCTLKLELTESAIMENAESATVMLSQLRKLGVQLYMDDFGTGYSSLSYLQRFPINTLKIDRSFIIGIGTGDENREIVRTIVALARNLGMNVTAEGVETDEQLAFLRTLECDFGQGYFFSEPVDGVEAGVLIKAEQNF